jgi:hypothetical protein
MQRLAKMVNKTCHVENSPQNLIFNLPIKKAPAIYCTITIAKIVLKLESNIKIIFSTSQWANITYSAYHNSTIFRDDLGQMAWLQAVGRFWQKGQ